MEVLRLRQPPSPRQGFMEMGLDSLMAVELRNRLQSLLGMPLAATLLFKYATTQDLAAFLAQQITPQTGNGNDLQPAVSVESVSENVPEIDTASAETSDLSQSELDALIGEELAQLAALL